MIYVYHEKENIAKYKTAMTSDMLDTPKTIDASTMETGIY